MLARAEEAKLVPKHGVAADTFTGKHNFTELTVGAGHLTLKSITAVDDGIHGSRNSNYLIIGNKWRLTAKTVNGADTLEFEYKNGTSWQTALPLITHGSNISREDDTVFKMPSSLIANNADYVGPRL